MILILQVMMKIIYTLESQKMILSFQLTQHYRKTILLKKSPSNTPQETTSAIIVQTNSPSLTHCSQVIPFYDTFFFKYTNYFQGFFLPDDYSLDIKTIQQ